DEDIPAGSRKGILFLTIENGEMVGQGRPVRDFRHRLAHQIDIPRPVLVGVFPAETAKGFKGDGLAQRDLLFYPDRLQGLNDSYPFFHKIDVTLFHPERFSETTNHIRLIRRLPGMRSAAPRAGNYHTKNEC